MAETNTKITIELTPAEFAAFQRMKQTKLPGVAALASAAKQLILTHPDYIEAESVTLTPADG